MPWDSQGLDGNLVGTGDLDCLNSSDMSDQTSITPESSLSSWPDQDLLDEPEDAMPKPKTQRTLAPNLTRRSHKKSRGGCFNCKSRKIKCQENRPTCYNCELKTLECRYPSEEDKLIKRRPVSSPAVVLAEASVPQPMPFTSDRFSLLDFRFFHHFLTQAYPTLPLGNEHVWVREIPIFAQEHGYLMHAILALGASHLSRITPGNDYNSQAIVHRGYAIEGLNQAITKTNYNTGEADAMLATCYALTFQASYMGDGLRDFLTFVRGCALVTNKVRQEASQTTFDIDDDVHLRIHAPRLDHLPPIDLSILTAATSALSELETLLTTALEHEFQIALLNIVLALQHSSRAGYINFMLAYGFFYNMSHEDFPIFVDTNNMTTQLLLAYFISIQLVITPLAQYEFPHRADVVRAEIALGHVEWAERIFDKLPLAMQKYTQWPRMIIETVKAEIADPDIEAPIVLRLKSRISQ